MEPENRNVLISATAGVVSAMIAANFIPAGPASIAAAIGEVAAALQAIGEVTNVDAGDAAPAPTYEPAVSVRKSLASKDHIISMIDGKPYKTLRRHLSTHGLTPDEYRERYGLKPDYPMVADSYSETRRAMALKIGLGRKAGSTKDDGPTAA